MRPARRRERIVGLLHERHRASVQFLAEQLSSSPETIRRDLAELAAQGVIRKFHGGAALPEMAVEDAFSARQTEHTREKRAVARLAASLFGPGDTLFVDTGTTTVLFAEELARRSSLVVLTNSATIARTISTGTTGNRVFLIGGEYGRDAAETLGPMAIEQIAGLHAAHAVICVGAIDASGIMDYSLDEAGVARAMIAQARTLTVVADSSKLGRTALFTVCRLGDVDRLVVDRAPAPALAEALRAADVEVLIAPVLDLATSDES
jgi:DeoR family glycerol-3-phosphate regulon repressor